VWLANTRPEIDTTRTERRSMSLGDDEDHVVAGGGRRVPTLAQWYESALESGRSRW
jgi:hypothetical protein